MVRQHPVDDLGRQVHAALGRLGGQGGQLVGVGQRIQAEHQVPAQAGAQVPRSGIDSGRGRRPRPARRRGRWRRIRASGCTGRTGRPAGCRPCDAHRPPRRTSASATWSRRRPARAACSRRWRRGCSGVGARGERAQQMAAAAAGRAPYVERAGRRACAPPRALPVGAGDEIVQRRRWRRKNVEQQLAVHGSYSIRLACGAVRTSDPRHGTRAGCPAAARPRAVSPGLSPAPPGHAGGRIRQRIPAVKSGQTEWVKNRVNRLTKTAGQNRYRPTLHFKPPEGRCRASPPFRPWLPADSGRLGASAPACGQLRAAAS